MLENQDIQSSCLGNCWNLWGKLTMLFFIVMDFIFQTLIKSISRVRVGCRISLKNLLIDAYEKLQTLKSDGAKPILQSHIDSYENKLSKLNSE